MQNKLWVFAVMLTLAGCSKSEPDKKISEPAVKKATHAPDNYRVLLDTSKGPVTIEVTRAWAPRGADRFFELVNEKYFDEARFYRVLPKFIAQFGIAKDPAINRLWSEMKIVDDPRTQSNKKGTVSFAKDAPNSRTTQVFINLADNAKRLDSFGFTPFGKVVDGMENAEKFSPLYGEVAPRGSGPDPIKAMQIGNEYFERSYPRLDSIKTTRVLP